LEATNAREELNRHLPSSKKPSGKVVAGSRTGEFAQITRSSALLHELVGQKLASTIQAFCKRAEADAGKRRGARKGAAAKSGAPKPRDSKVR
jgi:hypothetical protein